LDREKERGLERGGGKKVESKIVGNGFAWSRGMWKKLRRDKANPPEKGRKGSGGRNIYKKKSGDTYGRSTCLRRASRKGEKFRVRNTIRERRENRRS